MHASRGTRFRFLAALLGLVLVLPVLTSVRASAMGPTRPSTRNAVSLEAADLLHPVRKPPYLISEGDNTQIRVLWQLTVTDTCRIEWGLDTLYSLGAADTYEYGADHQHGATITGLTPATRYFYRVVAEADTFAGEFLTFPQSDAGTARFIVYGDTRTYPATHDQVAAAIRAAVGRAPGFQSLLLSVGDLVSDGESESAWDDEFFDPSYPDLRAMLASMPYQSCMGNHEGSGALFQKYFPYPFQDTRYWSFDYGPAHFVMVDQYTDYSPGSAQHAWIENDLSATTKPWRFFVLHEPGWSAGGHGNNTTVQDVIQPLCVRYGVRMVFAGHNHYYARAEVGGIEHITTGGGGAPLYSADPGYPHIVATAEAHHFCEVTLDDNILSFAAVSMSGDTLDTFTLHRTPTAVEPGSPGPRFVLQPAFPNPFTNRTLLSFSLPERAEVTLTVYDLTGRRVRSLLAGTAAAGRHEVSWDGCDEASRRVRPGLYLYRLQSGREERSGKVLLRP